MTYKAISFEGTAEWVNTQWLEARKHGIGGSDAAAILGLNNYATPYTVWLEKTGRAESADLSDNEKVYWGNVLEDVIAQEFAKRHPEFDVQNPNAMFVSEDHPYMFASVDRLVYDLHNLKYNMAVLEIKTCGERRRSYWDDGVPAYYLAQVNHYLAVTGFKTAYVAVLIGGQEYREYKIGRDDTDIAYLIEKEHEFWQMVETDTVPPFVGSSVDNAALLDQHPASEGEFLSALDDDLSIIELEEIKASIKTLEKDKKRLESELRAIIGDAKGINTPRYKCTWVRTESKRFDAKRFESDHPDLYDAYCDIVARDMGLRVSKQK